MDFDKICELVIDILSDDIANAGYTTDGFDVDLNLIEAGVIDSFGFLVLISEFEARTEIKIDLEALDFNTAFSVGGFAKFILTLDS